jgi:hypothetical protein
MSETTIDEAAWISAKEHFDTVRQSYLDLDGIPGVNVSVALNLVFRPLSKRYNGGERTQALYDEMLSVR